MTLFGSSDKLYLSHIPLYENPHGKQVIVEVSVASGVPADAVKTFKPAPQTYQLAVEKFGVPKERIGFVSSNFWDAAGAKSFGFQVSWVNRGGVVAERLGFRPDRVLRSLGEL